MATNLENLRVSLTKHGAHKIAYLLEAFSPDDILNHLDGDYREIKIDASQVRGNMSISDDGQVPKIWFDIKKYKLQDIFDLVFLSILYSHHDLIDAMKIAFQKNCTLIRGEVIDGKAYTNFAHILEELGFAIDHTPDFITFDISRIYYKFYLIPFFSNLLQIKLRRAGWEGVNPLEDEVLKLSLNESIGLSPSDFIEWFRNQDSRDIIPIAKAVRDFPEGVRFIEGHVERTEDDLLVLPKGEAQRLTLLHNKMQNKLYKILCRIYSEDKIGTEIYSNGGSIDILRRIKDDLYVVYEIKTSKYSRINIRYALPQLLEYAYWKPLLKIEKLIIIGPCDLDEDSQQYLNFLRQTFNLKIYYQFFNPDTSVLGDEK